MPESGPFDPNLSENRTWLSIADLVGDFPDAKLAVLGAPLGAFSITPGKCDLAPAAVRAALRRLSVYDVETDTELRDVRVFDAGDLPLKVAALEDALAPLSDTVAAEAKRRDLVILLGGNNGITRAGVHGLD